MEEIQILYEDNHLIAVYKPAGLLVQGDISHEISLLDMVKDYIKKQYNKPGEVFLGLVHRLDRPVAGVVVFARTSKSASRLSIQWRQRSITKIYWALVHGKMPQPSGRLTSFLKKRRQKVTLTEETHKRAQEAALTYRTLFVKGEVSLLEINLLTGRKHQIRAQLAAEGCPIVGDLKYGARQRREDGTICLLAKSLTFMHPTRPETIHIEAPTPEWAL
ncbi:MAG: RluA family pseudouridine synthase [Desulfobacterota bacterium]|jgi:23S rRNA pseudouridine1911/1915/1917 synthase|nr:RluA family pseudouridine synthase [Thermodesulfobacteriota bacterium]